MNEPFFDPETGEILSDAPQSNVTEFSVSEISGQLKRLVEDSFSRVRVRGEVGRVSRPASGHIYLDLKDDRSVLAGVIWKGAAAKLQHRPEEGMEMVATGKLTTFPGSSKYQIVIESLEPAGAGALMALLEERKRKLEAEGLFEAERKRPLPSLPRVIGVITSPTGAVIRDILHRVMDRYPLHVIVWPVRVQGETTGAEVSAAIRGFNSFGKAAGLPRPDVLIVARGGGSVEDLWGFNDEAVVRAAAESAIPLISAVGHETDWTLIDLAADLRAPTPTGAAEFAVPVKSELDAQVATLKARLGVALSRTMDSRRTGLRAAARGLPSPDSLFSLQNQRLDAAIGRLGRGLFSAIQSKSIDYGRVAGKLAPSLLQSPVRQNQQKAAFLASRLRQATAERVQRGHDRLAALRLTPAALAAPVRDGRRKLAYASQTLATMRTTGMERLNARLAQAGRLLDSFSHQKTLERGFALVHDHNGRLVTMSSQTEAGGKYRVHFADGAISVTRDGEPGGRKHRQTQPSASKPVDDDIQVRPRQGDLF